MKHSETIHITRNMHFFFFLVAQLTLHSDEHGRRKTYLVAIDALSNV